MKYALLKDRRRRILHSLYERRRQVLRAIRETLTLSPRLRGQAYRALLLLPRDSSRTRLRNRCTLTGRSRSTYRRFGLSRLRFRKLAWEGKLLGVRKASWLLDIQRQLINKLYGQPFLQNKLSSNKPTRP
jgi:small subunit ribosomal protein S14